MNKITIKICKGPKLDPGGTYELPLFNCYNKCSLIKNNNHPDYGACFYGSYEILLLSQEKSYISYFPLTQITLTEEQIVKVNKLYFEMLDNPYIDKKEIEL